MLGFSCEELVSQYWFWLLPLKASTEVPFKPVPFGAWSTTWLLAKTLLSFRFEDLNLFLVAECLELLLACRVFLWLDWPLIWFF